MPKETIQFPTDKPLPPHWLRNWSRRGSRRTSARNNADRAAFENAPTAPRRPAEGALPLYWPIGRAGKDTQRICVCGILYD